MLLAARKGNTNMNTDIQSDEFIDIFLKFEEQNEMFQIKINNVFIWHYLRYHVYNDFLELKGYRSFARRNVQKKKYNSSFELVLKKSIFCNQFLAHKRDALLFSHGRKYKDDDKYYKCPYTTLLDQYLSMPHYVLDRPTPDGNYEMQKSHNILYYDLDEFNRKLHVSFSNEKVSKTEIDKKIIEPLEQYFAVNIDVKIKKKWGVLINQFVNMRKYYINYFNYMLNRIRPKIILVVCAYAFDCMVLCEVAHKMNISVVELQHGTIGSDHIAYNFYKKMRLNSFPDYVFTFGRYEKEYARFPLAKTHIIPTGYPELENIRNRYKKMKSNKKNILFISQTLIEIAKFANEVAENIDSDKYQIIFQLHPFEYSCWKSTIGKYLSHPNIKVVGNYEHTVYESLAQADWVVGNYSTVLSEAQMFGVKVAVMKVDLYRSARFLYQNGYAILVDSPEQLINEIEKDTFQPNKEVSLFERNSLVKMQESIDKIINYQS